jgi:hypothetical protein
MSRALIATLALLLSGCGLVVNPNALRDMVDALAKDHASACVTAHATLYGTLTICRSNAAQARIMFSPDKGLSIEHAGVAAPEKDAL